MIYKQLEGEGGFKTWGNWNGEVNKGRRVINKYIFHLNTIKTKYINKLLNSYMYIIGGNGKLG